MRKSKTEGNELERNEEVGVDVDASDPMPPAMMGEDRLKRKHEHSHAAHLQENQEKPHTKPAIDMRESKLPGKRKQP
jgi:hypothetical protein